MAARLDVVHSAFPIPEDVVQLARSQDGVISRSQALQFGLSRHNLGAAVTRGHWTRLANGIYLVHRLAPSWGALAWAGVLVGGQDAALRGKSAAHCWGFIDDAQTPISVVVPADQRIRPGGVWWEFTRVRAGFRPVGSPPRLTVERTVLDLCASDPDRCAHWVTAAVGSRRTTPSRIRTELEALPRHPARQQLRELLGDVGQGARSPLELVYLRDVERAHKMNPGRRQFRSGGYVCDVGYDEGLVVELDGRRGHEGPGTFRDMDRDNYHLLRGVQTLRFGWQQCHASPCRVAATVAEVRRSLGWTGCISPCRRCRLVPEAGLLVS